jgi:hypothetical protein
MPSTGLGHPVWRVTSAAWARQLQRSVLRVGARKDRASLCLLVYRSFRRYITGQIHTPHSHLRKPVLVMYSTIIWATHCHCFFRFPSSNYNSAPSGDYCITCLSLVRADDASAFNYSQSIVPRTRKKKTLHGFTSLTPSSSISVIVR